VEPTPDDLTYERIGLTNDVNRNGGSALCAEPGTFDVFVIARLALHGAFSLAHSVRVVPEERGFADELTGAIWPVQAD
jgi:hypothetical protein